jgi:hypothetical protein
MRKVFFSRNFFHLPPTMKTNLRFLLSRFGMSFNDIPISELLSNNFLNIRLCFIRGQAILRKQALVYDFLTHRRDRGKTRLECGY